MIYVADYLARIEYAVLRGGVCGMTSLRPFASAWLAHAHSEGSQPVPCGQIGGAEVADCQI